MSPIIFQKLYLFGRSSRETYGDAAIGYVCLKRDENLCILKASVCPEHKVRDKPYQVTLIINEVSSTVNTVECHDCPASLGKSRNNAKRIVIVILVTEV